MVGSTGRNLQGWIHVMCSTPSFTSQSRGDGIIIWATGGFPVSIFFSSSLHIKRDMGICYSGGYHWVAYFVVHVTLDYTSQGTSEIASWER